MICCYARAKGLGQRGAIVGRERVKYNANMHYIINEHFLNKINMAKLFTCCVEKSNPINSLFSVSLSILNHFYFLHRDQPKFKK